MYNTFFTNGWSYLCRINLTEYSTIIRWIEHTQTVEVSMSAAIIEPFLKITERQLFLSTLVRIPHCIKSAFLSGNSPSCPLLPAKKWNKICPIGNGKKSVAAAGGVKILIFFTLLFVSN